MVKQRLWALAMLALCAVIIAFACGGQTPEERDVTAAAFLLPFGVYGLITKRDILGTANIEGKTDINCDNDHERGQDDAT